MTDVFIHGEKKSLRIALLIIPIMKKLIMIRDKYFLQVENIGYFVSRNIAQATSVN